MLLVDGESVHNKFQCIPGIADGLCSLDVTRGWGIEWRTTLTREEVGLGRVGSFSRPACLEFDLG